MKTTAEMDGLFTPEDVANQYKVMAQCSDCGEYSLWDKEDVIDHETQERGHRHFKCSFCGGNKHVGNSGVSLRTFNPTVHNKKKKRK